MDPDDLGILEEIRKKVDSIIGSLDGEAATTAPTVTLPPPGALDSRVIETFQKISSILDPQELLAAIMASVIDITGAQRGFIMLMEDGSKLRFKVGVGITQETLSSREFSTTMIKRVIQGGEAVFMTDAIAGGDASASIASLGLRTLICVPLIFGGGDRGEERVGGVIYVDSTDEVESLSKEAMRLVQALARQAAVSIENSRIFDKADRDRNEILQLKESIAKLYEVGQSLSRTLDLDELLVLVTDHAIGISKAERGYVMLLEGKGESRTLVYKVGRDDRRRTLQESHFAFSKSMAEAAIKAKKAQVLTDTSDSGSTSVSIVQMELQSVMCVPLLEKGEVIGLLYIDSKMSNKEFGPTDLELLESLAGSAAVAIVNAKLYLAATEQARMAHEMDRAAEIQRQLLPKSFPDVDGLQIWGLMVPAREVGGDYYDFLPHADTTESLTICIGDVSGKGVGAGMVMTMARTVLHSLIASQGVPTSTTPILQNLNTLLCGSVKRGMFMTALVCNWWARHRSFRFTPAGHEHVLVYRHQAPAPPGVDPTSIAAYRSAAAAYGECGKTECTRSGGVALAVIARANEMMQEKEIILAPGDQILLYSDGVTEARNEGLEELGLDCLVGMFGKWGHLPPEALCNKIHDELKAFRGSAVPHDDITLVALRCSA